MAPKNESYSELLIKTTPNGSTIKVTVGNPTGNVYLSGTFVDAHGEKHEFWKSVPLALAMALIENGDVIRQINNDVVEAKDKARKLEARKALHQKAVDAVNGAAAFLDANGIKAAMAKVQKEFPEFYKTPAAQQTAKAQ